MSSSRAKHLRLEPTPAEVRMWRLLFPFRGKDYHFRKQAPIGPYVADFACHHVKLVIEIDGETHAMATGRAHDAVRDAFLKHEGYLVLRFSNREVLHNPEGVWAVVAGVLEGRPASPRGAAAPSPALPSRGRVRGCGCGQALPQPERDTLPLVGRDGEGG